MQEIGIEMLQAKQEKNLQEQVQEQGEKQQQQLNCTYSELMIDKSSLEKILDDNTSLVENFQNNFDDKYDGKSLLTFVFLMFKKLEVKIDELDTKFDKKFNDLDNKFQLLERKVTLTYELQIKDELKERLETEFNIEIRKMDSALFRSSENDKY